MFESIEEMVAAETKPPAKQEGGIKKKPATKKPRIEENLTTCQLNWNIQYDCALKQLEMDRFASVAPGDPIYNWMSQALKKANKFATTNISPEEHDKNIGSSSWTSHNIEKVRHLLEPFKSSRDSVARASARAIKQCPTPPHHSRQTSSFNSPDFFESAIDLHPSTRA